MIVICSLFVSATNKSGIFTITLSGFAFFPLQAITQVAEEIIAAQAEKLSLEIIRQLAKKSWTSSWSGCGARRISAL